MAENKAEEAALRDWRNKLRLAQALMGLLAVLVTGVPDMRGLHGFRLGEVELMEPAERQAPQETAAPLARASEDAEEFFGNDAPDARIRNVRLSLSDGAPLRGCAVLRAASGRHGCANPPTGPPTV